MSSYPQEEDHSRHLEYSQGGNYAADFEYSRDNGGPAHAEYPRGDGDPAHFEHPRADGDPAHFEHPKEDSHAAYSLSPQDSRAEYSSNPQEDSRGVHFKNPQHEYYATNGEYNYNAVPFRRAFEVVHYSDGPWTEEAEEAEEAAFSQGFPSRDGKRVYMPWNELPYHTLGIEHRQPPSSDEKDKETEASQPAET
ncbi:hypothetical protein PFICI_14046 [Pestalotiopsis fici W106-1]|uniref:Uncharacterized protein n=1 Tax=Pestalotiopsis fici (strain W106-1 / CGMCC3.15140) TaxID=1229662 RepID=W3WJT0_PESFW|nr:uncharacterized protein PFICI_14046 [Pestalotiopsis fici W106-1]ETS74180.1 hypothetical protein PFICI_14046 [Pestalotiopsis fici W106-1]